MRYKNIVRYVTTTSYCALKCANNKLVIITKLELKVELRRYN